MRKVTLSVVLAVCLSLPVWAGKVKVASIKLDTRQAVVNLATASLIQSVEVTDWSGHFEGRILMRAPDSHWQVQRISGWQPILTAKRAVDKLNKKYRTPQYRLERRKICTFVLKLWHDGKEATESVKVVISGTKYRTASKTKHGQLSSTEPRALKSGWVEAVETKPIPPNVIVLWRNQNLFMGSIPRL